MVFSPYEVALCPQTKQQHNQNLGSCLQQSRGIPCPSASLHLHRKNLVTTLGCSVLKIHFENWIHHKGILLIKGFPCITDRDINTPCCNMGDQGVWIMFLKRLAHKALLLSGTTCWHVNTIYRDYFTCETIAYSSTDSFVIQPLWATPVQQHRRVLYLTATAANFRQDPPHCHSNKSTD